MKGRDKKIKNISNTNDYSFLNSIYVLYKSFYVLEKKTDASKEDNHSH